MTSALIEIALALALVVTFSKWYRDLSREESDEHLDRLNSPLARSDMKVGATETRVRRLISWTEAQPSTHEAQTTSAWVVIAGCMLLVAAIANYGRLLAKTHTLTEWFMR